MPGQSEGWQPMPVTALEVVDEYALIIAAKGSFLCLIDEDASSQNNYDSGTRYRAFEGQTIHGLIRINGDANLCPIFAAWLSLSMSSDFNGIFSNPVKTDTIKGNDLLRFFALSVEDPAADKAAHDIGRSAKRHVLEFLGTTLVLPGWVVAACDLSSLEPLGSLALSVLTANNEVLVVSSTWIGEAQVSRPSTRSSWTYKRLALGRSIALYSGHMLLDVTSLVIASGTVFGQVLLWKIPFEDCLLDSAHSSSQIASFHAHEGSVFGVHIGCAAKQAHHATVYHVASCSDDRTVRVYEAHDVGDMDSIDAEMVQTGFAEHLENALSNHVAVGVSSMSVHISRIWSVRWLGSLSTKPLLLSFGEDTTSQLWQVQASYVHSKSKAAASVIQLKALASHEFHVGKNIWSTALRQEFGASNGATVYTGGADGRIVRYDIDVNNLTGFPGQLYTLSQSTLDRILASSKEANATAKQDATGTLFASLEGKWIMHRAIKSRRPEYPSGIFDGKASLTKRPVSDIDFDGEMLYSEEGNFTMENGMSFPARRSYVYRYEIRGQKITAWFVKPDGSDVVDYLFHQVKFQQNGLLNKNSSSDSCLATGYHLCVRDHYHAEYTFDTKEGSLQDWTLKYQVTGPEKDYTATSNFRRDAEESNEAGPIKETRILDPYKDHNRHGTFRAYCWVNKDALICVTDTGDVIGAQVPAKGDRIGTPSTRYSPSMESRNLSSWLIASIPSLRGYSMLTRLGSIGCLIADGRGCITFVPFHANGKFTSGRNSCRKICDAGSKVIFLSAQETNTVDNSSYAVTCQVLKGHRICHFLLRRSDLLSSSDDHTTIINNDAAYLANPKSLKITSATFSFHDGLIICGTREGEICLWRMPPQSQAVNDTEAGANDAGPIAFAKIHGADTVTSISVETTPLTCESSGRSFWTCGIDGFVKHHVLRKDGISVHVETISALRHQSGFPLHGLQLALDDTQVLVWGFMGIHFVLWNLTKQQELLRVNCGSGHRIWAFKPTSGSHDQRSALVWTQAGDCRVYQQDEPSHRVLASGGHGREIKAIISACFRQYRSLSPVRVAVTGAEDTNIRIFEVGSTRAPKGDVLEQPSFTCIATLYKHITGLSTLAFVPKSNILLSGGGKEELFAWRISLWRRKDSSLPDVICIGACQKVTEDGDLRVTDLDVVDPAAAQGSKTESFQAGKDAKAIVSAVYSDSSIRIWHFDITTGEFEMLAEARYSTKCLTCAKHVIVDDLMILLIACTDGHVLLYDLSPVIYPGKSSTQGKAYPKPQLKPLLRHRTHQNSIKGLDVRNISRREFLVATGGDDNGLALTRISLICDSPQNRNRNLESTAATRSSPSTCFAAVTISIPRAHAAAVNAVRFLGLSADRDSAAETLNSNDAKTQSFSIATASNDQIVRTWQVGVASKPDEAGESMNYGLRVERHSQCSDVADASCLDSFDGFVVVGGVGIEVLDAHGGA